MKKRLLIYGAGGLGLEVLALVKALPEWEVAGFVDDSVTPGEIRYGVKVLGGIEVIRQQTEVTSVVLAIGSPLHKAEVIRKIRNEAVQFPVLIHPSVILHLPDTISIGEGTVITAGVILTAEIAIGRHVLLNLNTTVGHHSKIGSYCSIMPGVNIAGNVTLGEAVLVGAGANVINNISVGNNGTIGMGAVVLHPVAEGSTVAGVPAKPIRP